MTSPRLRLAAGAVLISFTGVLARLADVSGVTTALYRLVYALPVLVAAFAVRAGQGKPPRLVAAVSAVGLLDGGSILLYHLAIERSGVAVPTLVVNLHVVVAAIGGAVVFGDRLTRRHWAAMAVTLAGIVAVADPGGEASGASAAGVALAAGAAVLVGGYFLGLRRVRTGRADLTSLDVVASVTPASLAVNLVAAAAAGQAAPPPSWAANAWLVVLAICTPVLGTWLIVSSIGRMASVTSSAILLLQPLLAFVWGAAFFHEVSAAPQLAGFALALVGIALLTFIPAGGPASDGQA